MSADNSTMEEIWRNASKRAAKGGDLGEYGGKDVGRTDIDLSNHTLQGYIAETIAKKSVASQDPLESGQHDRNEVAVDTSQEGDCSGVHARVPD